MLKRLLILTIFQLCVAGNYDCAGQLTDSLLREQLTRGVQLWQLGKPLEAYTTLDSVTAQPTTQENAATKVKAAIWTASYLQQQKKAAPALRFLDSARTWAENYARGDEYRRVYEAYSQWHLAAGNLKGAMAAREQAWQLSDSLKSARYQSQIDSLKDVLDAKTTAVPAAPVREIKSDNGITSPFTIGLGVLSAILLLVVFRMNTALNRLRGFPPAPQRPLREPQGGASEPLTKKPEPPAVQELKSAPAPVVTENMPAVNVAPPLTAPAVNNKDLTVKLAEVELVLIRPEVLGRYGNSDWKSVKNLLNEYLSQLPLILKNLDDAITKSETTPILQGLEYLKPYLQPFGMSSTLALIREVEDEADQVKASKLLSRVFQVRNHTRRAADEAKAILEKFS